MIKKKDGLGGNACSYNATPYPCSRKIYMIMMSTPHLSPDISPLCRTSRHAAVCSMRRFSGEVCGEKEVQSVEMGCDLQASNHPPMRCFHRIAGGFQ